MRLTGRRQRRAAEKGRLRRRCVRCTLHEEVGFKVEEHHTDVVEVSVDEEEIGEGRSWVLAGGVALG